MMRAMQALNLVTLWLLAVLGVPGDSVAQTARELRVLTFNIHHAEGEDGRLDVARVADVITRSGAAVVALQEVDRGAERSGRRDLLKELADLTGMRYAFGKNIDLQGGDYGNGLLTSRPIVSEGNRLLPTTNGGEQRGVLQVVIEVDGTQVLVLATHLDHRRDDAQRVASAGAMLEMLKAWGNGPVIALGDFNDVPDSATYQALTAAGLVDVWRAAGEGDGFTIPVTAPNRRIDWILVRGLEPVRAEVLKTDASDHLPVAATVKLR
jgi:endonuclease/exonuclease/phosphatase family metal-dependent hydrolase